MNKKILIWSITIILAIAVIFIISKIVNNQKEELVQNETIENSLDISEVSDEPVDDECLNEWKDYDEYISSKIEEASNNMGEDDTHYLLKDVLGYIEVYYLDKDKNEFLYKKTTIPTTYLSEEDVKSLKSGIEVVGLEELNKLLEDFE